MAKFPIINTEIKKVKLQIGRQSVAALIFTPFGMKQIRTSKNAYMMITPTINRGDNSFSDLLRVKTNRNKNIKESNSKKIVI
jgi:hypothetical protein